MPDLPGSPSPADEFDNTLYPDTHTTYMEQFKNPLVIMASVICLLLIAVVALITRGPNSASAEHAPFSTEALQLRDWISQEKKDWDASKVKRDAAEAIVTEETENMEDSNTAAIGYRLSLCAAERLLYKDGELIDAPEGNCVELVTSFQ